jgi:hypothetical protein
VLDDPGGRKWLLALLLPAAAGCSTITSGAASIVPSSFVSRDMCLDLDRLCWGPYAPATRTFYVEVKDNALQKFGCSSIKCPDILALADEQIKAKGWCPDGYSWDDPSWIRGVFRMPGRCK